MTEDLVVLPGATLEIAPGSVLDFAESESTKVDPEYFHGGTELVVRGALRADNTAFRFPGRSGGIVVHGGTAGFSGCSVTGAEAGIAVLGGGRVTVAGTLSVTDCRVGAALLPAAGGGWAVLGQVTLEGNGIGAVLFPGAPPVPPSFRATGNEEADLLAWDEESTDEPVRPDAAPPAPVPGARRVADLLVDRDTEFDGDVVVEGVVRVAPGATLTVRPGGRLFFAFRDTDGDGIGESGLLLQGNLFARGTPDRPIGFHPLDPGETPGGWGRWDAINFMASDRGANVLEHVTITGAYRGLHAHFSRLAGADLTISRCFRGIQFQESEVELTRTRVVHAASALRCRDSEVRLADFATRDTASGANFLRSAVRLDRPDVWGAWYGLRFRESRAEVAGGRIRRGLVGLSAQEGKVTVREMLAEAQGLAGIAVQEGDVTITRCRVQGARLDALSVTRGRVAVTGGALLSFGRYAVKLGGPADVTLRGVDLVAGRGGPPNPIHDGKVAAGLGIVRVE